MNGNEENLRFGPFWLSRRRRQLLTNNGPTVLGTRAFDLLLVLVERAGRLISKPDLIDLVWGGQHVEEGNLHVQIAALRRVLGEHQGVIQNVPGRGYRFAGELSADAREEEVAPVKSPAMPEDAVQGKNLIGRDSEIGELKAMLGQTRLLSLVGPGGVGKTRLAVALMQGVTARFERAVLVDFAPLADQALVETAVLAALGLPVGESKAAAGAIVAAVKDRPTLLLFDNCEHVLPAVADLADALLRGSAAISILATSQESLRVEGEMVFRLDPLATPSGEVRDIAELGGFGSVALFVRRAVASDRRFVLDAANGPMIADICRRLDGMPLALEMAAARAASLGIEGLRNRLNERLRVLTSGVRTALARHRTLHNTVAWSYDLLDEADRAVFRRLGVFAGGFTAEAAAAIVMPEADEWLVIDALSRLIDKSMVVAGPGGKPRYHMLETLRMFAVEQMEKHAEQDAVAERHAGYFDRLFDDAYQDWESTDDRVWLARTSPELDNLRAALDWALATNAVNCLVSLAGSGALLWEKLSLFAEARRYLERAELALDANTPPTIMARLHRQIGNLWHSSDRPRALIALERAEALYRALEDGANLGAVLTLLGPIRGLFGATDAAAATLQEARLLLLDFRRPKSLFNILNNLGASAFIKGDALASRDFFVEALVIARDFGAPEREALVLINLAEVEFCLGDVEAAAERGITAASRLRALEHKVDLGWALVNLTAYFIILHRTREAKETAREAVSLVRHAGGFILRVCLQQWAMLASMEGNHDDAARLLGFVDFGFESAGETREHAERQIHDLLRACLDRHIPVATLARLASEGASWSESHAIKQVEILCQSRS